MPDTREAVMINKLALEYRKIRSLAGLTNGDASAMQIYQGTNLVNRQRMDVKAIRDWTRMKKRENYEKLMLGMAGNHTL